MAQLGREDEFEDRNAGVDSSEPHNAGPGFMGKILTTFSNVKQKVSSPRTPTAQQSTPSTPSGMDTASTPSGMDTASTPSGMAMGPQSLQETKVDDLNDTPRDAEARDVSMPSSGTADLDHSPRDAETRDVSMPSSGTADLDHSPRDAETRDVSMPSAGTADLDHSPRDAETRDVSMPSAGTADLDHSPRDAETRDVSMPSSRAADLNESPRDTETRDVSMPPSRTAPANDFPGDAETRDMSMPPSRTAPAVPEQSSPADQSHNDAVGLDTSGAGGRVGDGVETSSIGGPPMVNSRSVDTGASQEGTPASPTIPKKDFGEKIMDKLPFTHANPYSVGNPSTTQQAGNPYTAGDQTAVPASPSAQSREPHSPGLFGKLKNLVTGQKATQGTATENATTGTAGINAEREPMVQGYTQEPSPKSGDIFHKATEKLGGKGTDVGSAEAWPSPAKPDMSNIPSATRTDEEGRPIEGPTQPKSEDTKKEGLMAKLMDKLHLHSPNSHTGPNSHTAASATKGTSPTANSAQNTGAGMPTYTEHAPASSNPEGQATGPVET